MNDSLTDAASGRSPLMIGGILAGGALLLLLLIPTCRGPSRAPQDPTGGPNSQGGIAREQCERTLQSALDGLRPERLGLSSESRVMVDTLNNWLSQCLSTDVSAADDADVTLREQLLTESTFGITQQGRFQDWDAAHIRNSLLAKAIVDVIAGDARSDRDRAVELFYYLTRTVDLIPDGSIDQPPTPYETLLFGRGTAANRAWTFALLLRQLRLDCVMLQPRVEAGEIPYWILGVVAPGEGVYLFDTRLGLPIADADDGTTPLPRQPATLSQARENDGLLRQFDRGALKYPLTADALQTVDVFAIGTSSTWSPRMEQLQAELSEPVELYDGLAASRLRETGLIERLVAAGSNGLWTREQVRVWPYPESHWGEANQLGEQQQELVTARFRILEGPFDIAADLNEAEEPIPVAIKPPRTLRRARIDQLLGDYPAALQIYIRSRLKPQNFQLLPLPEVQINYFAADMAAHWGAQCQYEQRDYEAAANSALSYLNRPDRQFLLSAAYLQSLSLAQQGRQAEAVDVLSKEPPQAPQYLGDQKLVDRWRQQAAGDGNSPAATLPEASDPGGRGDDKTDEAKPDGGAADETDTPTGKDGPGAAESNPPPDSPAGQSTEDQPRGRSVSVDRERRSSWIG